MWLILALCCLLLLLSLKNTQSQREKTTERLQQLSKYCTSVAEWVFYATQIVGFTPLQASFIVAQTAFETGNYTSNLCVNHNNLSGITYSSRAVRLLGDENVSDYKGYCSYSSVIEWLYDYTNLMSVRYQSALKENDIVGFCKQLKEKGYYTASVYDYANGCATYWNKYKYIWS